MNVITDAPGCMIYSEHRMELMTNQPVKSEPYHIPYKIREELNSEMWNMLSHGII